MLLASIILSAFTCLADGQPSGTSQGGSGGGTLDTVRKGFDKIRMPSRDRIMIYYNNGELSLQSETVEGEFSLQLIHAESGAIESVPAITIGEAVALTLDAGIYQVSAYSSTGAQYSGELEIH